MSVSSVPRLRLESEPSRRTLLDGGWWPRSANPVEEIPGLVLAIDDRCGRVTRLTLGPAGWDSQPQLLGAAGRVIRIGWFPDQPAALLTAFSGDNGRMDLLVIPPGTDEADALAAMELASHMPFDFLLLMRARCSTEDHGSAAVGAAVRMQ